jgi:hypothetical protein
MRPAWLDGWVPTWLDVSLPGWLPPCLGEFLAGCMPAWLAGCLPAWLAGCLPAWLVGCLGLTELSLAGWGCLRLAEAARLRLAEDSWFAAWQAVAVRQSTEERGVSIFALSYSSSPPSASLTRSERVCIHSRLCTFSGQQSSKVGDLHQPQTKAYLVLSIAILLAIKPHTQLTRIFWRQRNPPTHSTPTQQGLETRQCVCKYNQFTVPM